MHPKLTKRSIKNWTVMSRERACWTYPSQVSLSFSVWVLVGLRALLMDFGEDDDVARRRKGKDPLVVWALSGCC